MILRAIALNTFREAVRDRVLYAILAFATLMMLSATVLTTLSVGAETKIIEDLGLASISLFGGVMAVFLGIGLVSREIDRRTIFTIMAKPVPRPAFILGKYAGLLLTLLVNVFFMTVGLVLLSAVYRGGVHWPLLLAAYLAFIELAVVSSVAIVFSTFAPPIESAIYSLGIFLVGRLSSDLKVFAAQFGHRGIWAVVDVLYYVLPNLSTFNVTGAIVHNLPVGGAYVAQASLYGLLYLSGLLVLAMVIFQYRDFK